MFKSSPPVPDPAPRSTESAGDAQAWARTVWADREQWLTARGGVESVFTAAQVLGCRDEAVAWLKSRTRT